ncbi:MAG TPA: AraC family transcriptional regulator [Caulobacteraceae bacterium]
MDAAPPDFRLLKFVSDALPAPARFDLWRDVVTRKLLRLAIDPLSADPFYANASLRSQHGLSIGAGDVGATVSHRTRDIVSGDNDDLVLIVNQRGTFLITQGERELVLAPGDATVISCAQVASFLQPDNGRLMCVRLPSAAMTPFLDEPDERAARLIPALSEPLRLLKAYATSLVEDDDIVMSPSVSRAVVNHLCDLVALALGASGEAAEFAAGRGVRAARLKALKNFVDRELSSSSLSIQEVADHIGVSPRYVRKLLEAEGVNFSGFVMEQRLARARAMLTSLRHAHMAISSIAYEVGFGDLSYFNRTFRRRYAMTPTEARFEQGASEIRN